MYVIQVPDTDPRLQKRYRKLVQQHLSTARGIAAGLRVLPQTTTAMAAALAAYRFYQNERAPLVKVAEPLRAAATLQARAACDSWALVVHDWSPLHYTEHESKQDRIVLYNKHDFGYLWQTALLISDRDGAPLAPLYLGVEAADGLHSTRRATPLPRRPELDELNRTLSHIEQQELSHPCVHLIDRQGESLLHLRRCVRCGRRFLIRSNDVRRVEHGGQSRLLAEVETALAGQFRFSRAVEFKGRTARQYVCETSVTLRQPAHPQRRRAGRVVSRQVRGRALTLRLVLAEVRDATGRVLATWRLWTNLPETVSATTVAQWYYWRWRIESFFKLLKRAGQHVEQWQQVSAEAIAKRLAVAAQACVIVWALLRSREPPVDELRAFLIRQSGRLMRRGVKYTAPALFAGLWNLLAIIDALDRYSVAELRQMGNLVQQMIGLAAESEMSKNL